MKKLHFDVRIRASRNKVWDTMFEVESYKEWTQPLAEGSYYDGSWEEGAKIRFLTPTGDGMFSEIAASHAYQFISIRHLGILREGKEDTQSDEARSFVPVYENYRFEESDGLTHVKVDRDSIAAALDEMSSRTWPKALAKLKEICERG